MTHGVLPPVQALVVVDVQSAFVSGEGAVPDAARLVDTTADLIARARRSGALVVHLQNDGAPGADDEPGTPGWALHHEVRLEPAEVVIRKPRDDGFARTSLGRLLTDNGVTSLAVCGVMSEMCVQATARTALARGYRVVLPYDAHATQDAPPSPGIRDRIPAATISRVVEWTLGGAGAEVAARASDVTFAAVPDRSAARSDLRTADSGQA